MDDFLARYPFHCTFSLAPLRRYVDRNPTAFGSARQAVLTRIGALQRKAPRLFEPIDDPAEFKNSQALQTGLMHLLFPPLTWTTEAVAVVVPFTARPVIASPCFERLFLDTDGTFSGRRNVDDAGFNTGRAIRAFLFILEKFYGIQQPFDFPLVYIVPDPETGLERHFRIKFDFRFVEARAAAKPGVLTRRDRQFILQHLTDPEKLKRLLPPENFELQGFTIFQATDVTEPEIIAIMQNDLIAQDTFASRNDLQDLQQRLRILFHRPDLLTGLDAIKGDKVLQISTNCSTSTCIFAESGHVPVAEFSGSPFEKAVTGRQIVRIPDIQAVSAPTPSEAALIDAGIRSLLIAPLFYKEKCIGILHLGSPHAEDLGPMDVLLLTHIQPLFSLAVKKALDDLDHRIQGVIKQKCTAIHPTVEWRFRKAAFQYLENIRQGKSAEIEPIVFHNVYSLYGVSDVRGSADARNRAIQADLIESLHMAGNIVQQAGKIKPMLILQDLARRIEKRAQGIQNSLETGDELAVATFLHQDVESIFPQLATFDPDISRAIRHYHGAIEPETGAVHDRRKAFEESISRLNARLAAYLDQEEAGAQEIFPHFFEKHRTDGVDHLIYLGPTLMEDGAFSDLFLKNLRLWQIKTACGLAWHTEQLKSTLAVPLDTAHLILVQNTPLSIRFRFDEKRFDVDGAYNTRQEIIKSRLDKARIKGSGERLTQPGRIALVYSHPEEAQEILNHIDFLRAEGYLADDPEALELAELPGVQGLKALRVRVRLDESTPAKEFVLQSPSS